MSYAKKKGIATGLLSALLAFGMTGAAGAAPAPEPNVVVTVDGMPQTFTDVGPVREDGRILLPMRHLLESLGATVTWNAATSTATAKRGGVTLDITVGKNVFLKNGQPQLLDVTAQTVGSRLMVPVRFIAEAFGLSVAWNEDHQRVSICKESCEPKEYAAAPEMKIDVSRTYHAILKTNKGDIRILLFDDLAPKTVNNFVFLAREHFYDDVTFHRVIESFMIQGGDPKGNGTGGPGYMFADELPPAKPYAPGILAMANAGPDTNGSQFFIGSGRDVNGLNNYPFYTVFGEVVSGMEAVQKIAKVPVAKQPHGEVSRPQEPVYLYTVVIEEE